MNRGVYRIVGLVWITLAFAYGVFFSFSIFFVPLIEEFRWSRALTAGAFSLSTIVQGALAPVTGALIDRFGSRPVITGGVICLGVSAILAGTVTTPWELYLYTGVLGAAGIVALGWVPMGVLLSRWVHEHRGRMVGIAFSGMGIGIFVVGPLAQWLIGRFGWRWATVALGVATLVFLLPIVWVGVRDPETDAEVGGARASTGTRAAGPTLGDALHAPAFWLLFGAYVMTPLAVFPIFTHQVAYAVDLGFPRLFVASVFGMMGFMSSVGRVGFGFLADRFGGPLAATLSYACTAGGALALVALEAIPVSGWLVAYAALFGLGFGARGPIITTMASERFGGRRFGVIYGVLNVGNGVGAAIGPWFGGAVHDATGSYRIAFLSSVVFCAVGAVCFWLAASRSPRRAP